MIKADFVAFIMSLNLVVSGVVSSQYESLHNCDNKRLNVTVTLQFYGILNVDEASETVTAKMSLQMTWKDADLSWEAQPDGVLTSGHNLTNGTITRRFADITDICTPDVTIEESTNTYVFPPATQHLEALILQDGTVVVYYPHTARMLCRMDVSLYPYDYQTCTISMWTVSRTFNEVELHVGDAELPGQYYSDNSEWQFVNGTGQRVLSYLGNYSYNELIQDQAAMPSNMLVYQYVLRRKPLFYLMNVVLPSSLVAWVASLGSFTPSLTSDVRQEKVRLGISALLSTSVQMVLISKQMPVTSDSVPILNFYYTVLIVTLSSAAVVTVVTLQVQHSGLVCHRRLPPLVNTLVCRYLAAILLMGHVATATQDGREGKQDDDEKNTSKHENAEPEKEKGNDDNEQSEEKDEKNASKLAHEWQRLAGNLHKSIDIEDVEQSDAKKKAEKEIKKREMEKTMKERTERYDRVKDWVALTAVTDRLFLVIYTIVIVFNALYLTSYRQFHV